MNWSLFFEVLGGIISALAALAGAWWAVERWRKRDEHFPRVYLEVSVNFVGNQDGQLLVELAATLENMGVVQPKIKDFGFKLLGLGTSGPLARGGDEIRGQLRFPHVLEQGVFVPEDWKYSLVYPGVKTEYNCVASIPSDVEYVRMQGDLKYLFTGETHHAATVQRVPRTALDKDASRAGAG